MPSDPFPIAIKRAPRVLVVDDDAEFAETLGLLLEEAGYEVVVGFSVTAALDHLRSFLPDSVVVDIHMPVVDGYALLAIVRSIPELRTCRVIAMSGDNAETAHGSAVFDGFFVKPFETGTLLARLNHER